MITTIINNAKQHIINSNNNEQTLILCIPIYNTINKYSVNIHNLDNTSINIKLYINYVGQENKQNVQLNIMFKNCNNLFIENITTCDIFKSLKFDVLNLYSTKQQIHINFNKALKCIIKNVKKIILRNIKLYENNFSYKNHCFYDFRNTDVQCIDLINCNLNNNDSLYLNKNCILHVV